MEIIGLLRTQKGFLKFSSVTVAQFFQPEFYATGKGLLSLDIVIRQRVEVENDKSKAWKESV